MKLNAIFGKKQIILASLVLILGVAVYLNWQFAKTGEDFAVTGQVDTAKNYGDAQLVDNPVDTSSTAATAAGDDYFTKTRLERTKSRDETTATLTEMLKDSALTEEEKQTATQQAVDLAKQVDSEKKMEDLVKAKGFEDCLVYINDENVDVVVKTDGLEAAQAAQIKDIVLSETEVEAENIRIVEVK